MSAQMRPSARLAIGQPVVEVALVVKPAGDPVRDSVRRVGKFPRVKVHIRRIVATAGMGKNRKDAEHRLFPSASDVKDDEGHVVVTAYAHERPDGQWSLMLVNKDYDHPHQVRIVFHNTESNRDDFFSGPVTMITFGKAQYQWHPDRKKGHADPDRPPVKSTLTAGKNTMHTLLAASLTIIRGKR